MKAKFKVGDSVRLKKNLKVGKEYDADWGRLTLLPSMAFDGTKVITEELLCNATCLLDNGYYYTFSMLIKEKPTV